MKRIIEAVLFTLKSSENNVAVISKSVAFYFALNPLISKSILPISSCQSEKDDYIETRNDVR